MTKPEQIFYDRLLKTFGYKYYIFPQMHLETLLNYHQQDRYYDLGAFRHIDQKSVDFVMCKKDYTPVLVIELDDKKHNSPEGKLRDTTVNDLLTKVGIPVFHVKNHGNLRPPEILDEIFQKLQQATI